MNKTKLVYSATLAMLALVLVACERPATPEAPSTEATINDGTSENADPTSIRENTSTQSEDPDITSDVDLTIELPEVPAGLDGGTISITSIEGGFTLENAPLRLNQGMCFGTTQGFLLNDDTTNAPPYVDMRISVSPGTKPGTYELVFNNPDNDPSFVSIGGNIHEEDARGVTQFTRLRSGVIRIDTLPSADGETFSGALQMTMFKGDETIGVEAVFNVTLDGDDLCGADA